MFLFLVGPTIVVSDIPAQMRRILALAKFSVQMVKATNPTDVNAIASMDELTVEGENLLE